MEYGHLNIFTQEVVFKISEHLNSIKGTVVEARNRR